LTVGPVETSASKTVDVLSPVVVTFADRPAEIRGPAGTLPGVSAFQRPFVDHFLGTAGDGPSVLVAMKRCPAGQPSGRAMTAGAVTAVGLLRKDAEPANNVCALWLPTWLYRRPPNCTRQFLGTTLSAPT
jgi:2-oxoglutarate ferredoxin oxidoreductase subunit alpha